MSIVLQKNKQTKTPNIKINNQIQPNPHTKLEERLYILSSLLRVISQSAKPGAGIMEADYRQVTTIFTVQPSFHHLHSTNRVS